MTNKKYMKGIFAEIGQKVPLIGVNLLVGMMILAPFAHAANGGTISGIIYNSNGHTLGQVKVELFNYVNVSTLSTATSLESDLLVETERTWNCITPTFVKPLGIPSSSTIYSDTTATNAIPPSLGISNNPQNHDALDTNTPPDGTALSIPLISNSTAINTPPNGSVSMNPQSANTTATNLAPSGSTPTISSQISNTSATNTSPSGTTASITPQSANTTVTNTKPIGLSSPTYLTHNATSIFSPLSGTVTISMNSEDATSTTLQPPGAPGSKSGTWYNGSFILEGDDDGNGIPDETIYWVLTDNSTPGVYDMMNLSYEDSSNFNDGNMADQIVGLGNDEGITGENIVTLGTYRFIVNFTSDPSTESPDAWITSNEWYTGSFNLDLNGDGSVGVTEIFYYSLTDNNSDGMYDSMDLSTDDDVFGEGILTEGNTTTDNDELIAIGGTDVRLGTYLFLVNFVENPNSSDLDATIQSKEWYTGSFNIDADDDGFVDDTVYFTLSDMNSEGLYDTMDLSFDTTYGEGNLNDDNVTIANDESITADDFLTLGNSYEFWVSFDTSPISDSDDARIKSNEWYKGTFTIDGDGDGVVEVNNVYYVLTDTGSDGIYEAMDISMGDQVYGEGDVGDFSVDFDNTDNTDDERITIFTDITLGDYYLFTVEFDGDPNLDSDDTRITSKEWYEGAFIIDADGDGSSDNNVLFILTDTNSDGLYEAMDISIGDSFYGEGDLNDFIVDFDALDNINDERITTSTNITLGDYYMFSVKFDQDPNTDTNDAIITSGEWYEGSFVIDADNDGTADDGVYFVLSDTNSNGIYDTMDISIEDQVYGETGGGTLSDGFVNYVSPGNNDNDEQITGISSVTLGDSLLFYVDFDSTPPADAIDAGVLIYEWYYGSFEMDADDMDDDGVMDDDVYYVLTDTDSNGLYDTMDISINDIIFGEVGEGGLFDGIVDYVTDTNNLDDERITVSSNITLGDSLLFAIEFDNNPDNSDQNDARILSIEWYTGNFSIDIDGDGSVDADGVNFALTDFNSQGLYNYYMEITTDDITYAEGIFWNQTTGLDDDEIIFESTGEFVRLGAYNYSVQSYDNLNDGLDVNDGVNYDANDAKIIINQWFTGNALLEGNLRDAVVADNNSDGIFDEIYIDINGNGDFGDAGIDAIAIKVSGTFQGSLLELQYTVVSIDPTGGYFEIQPTGASLGFTTGWFVGQIEVPSLSGDGYDVVLSDVSGDSVFETADFDTDLPGDSVVDSIGLTETFGTPYLGGDNYQVVNVEDSGAHVRISSYLDAVLDSDNDISLTNKFHYGIISESSLTLNLNQDGDMMDTYHTIVGDNIIPGRYETVFIDTDDDDRLSDQSLLVVSDSFSMETNPPFDPHTFEIDFIGSSGNYYTFKQTNHPVDTYMTSADGFYTLNAPTDGDYWIRITNSTTSWGYTTFYDTNTNNGINMINGNVIEGWDEYLTQTGNFIFGYVNDSLAHDPIDGVIIEVYDSNGGLVASTITKVEGSYLIAVEPGGSYDMVYRLQGYYTNDGRTTGTWQDLFIPDDIYSIDVLLVSDITPPSITLDYPLEGQTVGGTIDVKATAIDDFLLVAVEVSFDYGATYYVMTPAGGNIYTFTWNTTTYSEGMHRIIVRATDHGGYIDTDYNDMYVTNDGTSPSVSIVSPLDLEYVENLYLIRIFANDNYALQYVNITLNGTTYPTAFNLSSGYYEFQINTTILPDGIYTLSAEAKDYAGNSATDSLVTGFYVDNNAPTLSIYSPLNGELVSGTTVFIDIDSVDAGVFVPTVQYRIDNGPWVTLSGSEFLGWADIWDSTTVSNGFHTLTFRSYDSIGHIITDNIIITVDNDNPTASIVAPVMNEYVQGTYKFKVFASDAVEVTNVFITINAMDYITGFNSASGLWEVEIDTTTIPDGTYSITATVEDGISGHTQTTIPFNFNIDKHPPTLSINSPSIGETVYGDAVLMDADSTDEGAFIPLVQYRIDSGAWITLTGSEALGWSDSWNSSTVSNGIHIITFRAYDTVGHMVTDSVTITVDNDLPVANIVAPVPGEYVQDAYTFKVSASDAVGVTNLYITINSVDYITGYNSAGGYWEVTIDTNIISDGIYDITATVEDGIPGHTQTTTSFNFNIDNHIPMLSINSPLNGATVSGSTVSIDVTSTDEGVFAPTVDYRMDSGAWITLTGSEALGWTDFWDSNSVSNGIHTITFRAYDTIGHMVTDSVTITVDNDLPVANIVAPVLGEYVQDAYTFKVSASDAIGVTNLYITINNFDYITGYNRASGYWEVVIDTTTIPDGAYIITATVEDGIFGHTQTTTPFNFNIDNNAPTLSINSPINGAIVYGNAVSIDADSTDEGAFVPIAQYRMDNGAWITLIGSETLGWTDSWNSSTASNGIHTITFRAYDNIGHMVTDSVTVIVDNDNPKANVVAPVPGEFVQGTYIFKVSASDAVEVTNVYITINGMDYITGYNTANGYWEVAIDTTTIFDGTYDITATVEDGVPGHSQTTTPFTFNMDNNSPTLSLNSPSTDETVYGDAVLIDADSTDEGTFVSTVQYKIDGGAWITLTGSEILGWTDFWDSKSVSNGNHMITFRAYDTIGHIITESVTVIVDNDNPRVSVVAPVLGEYVQGTYNFKVSASDAVDVTNVFITIGGIDYIAGYNSANGFWQVAIDTMTFPDGTYGITATVEDGIPSHIQTTTPFNFNIDNNAPLLIIHWPLNGDYVRGNVALNITGNDLFLHQIEYNVDGTGWIENTTTWDTTNFADGSHTLTIRSVDLAGHTTQETITVIVTNMDTDGDGVGDLADPDIDGDNVGNTKDAFPYDSTEWIDTDKDGQGNKADEDDDSDGVPDVNDDFPLNPNEYRDTDGDGIGDNSDYDIDGDEVYNVNDAFPYNSSEWSDIDEDGIGDNLDKDIDGDGVLNDDDAFPYNPFEWRQSDNDGIGDNADEDDDDDGVPDVNDAFPLDPNEWRDTDEDGVGDNHDVDVDGDGVSNDDDEFPYNMNEWKDSDNDGIGNNADQDDDNDGIVDQEDYYPLDKSRYLEPFWWWWILIAMLFVTFIIVVFITQRQSYEELGTEEKYEAAYEPVIKESVEKEPEEPEEKPEQEIIESSPSSEEDIKLYSIEELKVMRKHELIKIAEGMDLPTDGTKAAIIGRIRGSQIEKMVEEAEKAEEEREVVGEEEIECPSCGMSFRVKVKEFPTVIECPHCGTPGTIN